MTIFLFTAAENGIRDSTYPLTGTFYGALTKTVPAQNLVTVNQLSLSTDPAYADQVLTTSVTTNAGASEFRVTANPTFPKLTSSETFTGMAIYRQIGASRDAAVDQLYWYSSWQDFLSNLVSPPIQLIEALEVRMPTDFLWSTNPGRFIFTTTPIDTSSANNFRLQTNGILGLLGTANKTVAFANPLNTKVSVLGGNVAPTGTLTNLKDRSNAASLSFGTARSRVGFRFLSNRTILPTQLILNYSNGSAAAKTINVFGATTLTWSADQITNGAWTQIGTAVSPNTAVTDQIMSIPLTAPGYIGFLAFEVVETSFTIFEIDIAGKISSAANNLN